MLFEASLSSWTAAASVVRAFSACRCVCVPSLLPLLHRRFCFCALPGFAFKVGLHRPAEFLGFGLCGDRFARRTVEIMSWEPFLSSKELQDCSFVFHAGDGRSLILQSESAERKPEVALIENRNRRQVWLVRWGQRRVLEPFLVILQRGLEPTLLAFSAALGFTIGVFPVCGVTAGLCALIAVILRSKCHWPTLVLANFVVMPLELGFVVPFMRVGELVTNEHHFPFTPSSLWAIIRGRGSRDVLFGALNAVIGWSIFAPVCVSVLFIMFLPIFRFLMTKFGPTALSGPELPVSNNAFVKQEVSNISM